MSLPPVLSFQYHWESQKETHNIIVSDFSTVYVELAASDTLCWLVSGSCESPISLIVDCPSLLQGLLAVSPPTDGRLWTFTSTRGRDPAQINHVCISAVFPAPSTAPTRCNELPHAGGKRHARSVDKYCSLSCVFTKHFATFSKQPGSGAMITGDLSVLIRILPLSGPGQVDITFRQTWQKLEIHTPGLKCTTHPPVSYCITYVCSQGTRNVLISACKQRRNHSTLGVEQKVSHS